MSSRVEVLCPNGHRVNVKTTPNTKILQILEEACAKQGFQPATDYELKHGRKRVDLTLVLRFSGLPNLAKLELVKAAQSRSGSAVTLALQLADGQRLQKEFAPTISLWDVLKYWESQEGDSEGSLTISPEVGLHPVCIYMREEIIGEAALMDTTLHSLGIITGRAAIRLIHRPVADETLGEIQDNIEKEKARKARLTAKPLGKSDVTSSHPQSAAPPATAASSTERVTSQCNEDISMDTASSDKAPEFARSTADHASVDPATADHARVDTATADHARVDTATADHARVDTATADHASVDTATADDPCVDTANARDLSENLVSDNKPSEAMETDDSMSVVRSVRPRPSERPIGGEAGYATGIPGVTMYPPGEMVLSRQEMEMARMLQQAFNRPTTEFKFPESTKGKVLYKNEFCDVNREEYKPCDRETVVYDADEPKPEACAAAEEDPGDDFFQVSEAEIRRMWSDLQRSVKKMTDAPLQTSAMRTNQLEEKIAKYDRVAIRVHFPDRKVLQGLFRPRETVFALYTFVKAHLEDKNTPFYLYTTPPKCVLKDKEKTIAEADLAPMSIVYLGSDVRQERHLSAEALAEMSTMAKADTTLWRHTQQAAESGARAGGSDPRDSARRAVTGGSGSGARAAGGEGGARAAGGAGGAAASGRTTTTGDAPKWFKLGSKK